MKETLLYILKHLVDHPDDLSVEEQADGSRTVFLVHVNPVDMGKIIGKSGRIIRAIRDLVKLIAAKRGVYADVELIEGQNPTTQDPPTQSNK